MSDRLEAVRRELHEALAAAKVSLAQVRRRSGSTTGPEGTTGDQEVRGADS
jgi:hypothetical protein